MSALGPNRLLISEYLMSVLPSTADALGGSCAIWNRERVEVLEGTHKFQDADGK
jgi:hypothetical protein